MTKFYYLFLFLFTSILVLAQDSSSYKKLNYHYEQAKSYNNLSQYGESINELNQALEISKELNWIEKYVELTIYRAEIKRKTNDFQEGLTDLLNLKESPSFPKLHVQKLGRIAAFYSQGSIIKSIEINNDSILHYIDSALKVSDEIGLINEKAGLYNELGFMLGSTDNDSSIFYLKKASKMFYELKDTSNFVVAQTNLMRVYTYAKKYDSVKSIITDVLHHINQENWNSLEVEYEFYRTLTYYYFIIEDYAAFNTWNIEKYRLESEVTLLASSRKLNSYRVLYETKKYQDKVAIKAKELEKEAERRKVLIAFLIVMVFFIIVVISLFLREKKLKLKVDNANEKYHMLIVESNHRIKNNLQMIISMIEYSGKDKDGRDNQVHSKMSGKIQTISALHKHLYLDVHNELVDMKSYFEDIISLYHDISNNRFKLKIDMDQINIPSERMVYFGLIFNEMLSNTIEHSKYLDTEIYISVVHLNGRIKYTYCDNSSFDSNLKGTGTLLVEQLVNRVEGNNYKVDGATGKYQFEFYA